MNKEGVIYICPDNKIKRNAYLDNLKLVLTFLVIAHHASQAYGPTGGEWVYVDPGNSVMWLGNFMAVNASFLWDSSF